MAKRQIVVDEVSAVTIQGRKGPFQKVNIKSGGYTLSSYPAGWNAALHPGDKVEVDIEKTEKDGRTYYNIKSGRVLNTKQDMIIEKLDEVLAILRKSTAPLPLATAGTYPPDDSSLPPGDPAPVDEFEQQPVEDDDPLPF
ncbi:MAG: hypothetical protein ACYTEU_06185 [Planctomycetota bacterium]|jgi:hypothetical protein